MAHSKKHVAQGTLSSRQEKILVATAEHHIRTGQPAGSFDLQTEAKFACSSATIRNELATLQALGYLMQPHTSAGRLPTAMGYRYFVKNLAPAGTVQEQWHRQLHQALDADPTLDEATLAVSTLLSQQTTHMGFVIKPSTATMHLRRVHTIALGRRRALVVCVLDRGSVVEEPVTIGQDVDTSLLERASNHLTHRFSGLTIAMIRAKIYEQIQHNKLPSEDDARIGYALLWSTLGSKRFVGEVVLQTANHHVDLSGLPTQTVDEWAHSDAGLRAMIDHAPATSAMNTTDCQVHLAGDLNLQHPQSERTAVVSKRFGNPATLSGSLGVIGPMNMDYSGVFAAVNQAAQAFERYLNPLNFVNQ